MNDANTSLQTLRDTVEAFVAERDWHQFHSPKNLSMALAIEAAELMEHFQWLTIDQSRDCGHVAQTKADIGEEMADVLCYLLALANTLELDLSSTMLAKMEKNRAKYPADTFRGRAK